MIDKTVAYLSDHTYYASSRIIAGTISHHHHGANKSIFNKNSKNEAGTYVVHSSRQRYCPGKGPVNDIRASTVRVEGRTQFMNRINRTTTVGLILFQRARDFF